MLYGSFLGTEGMVYRWLRQYGTVADFGCTCLCLLLAGCLVLLGLVNAAVAAWIGGTVKARVENVTEWWGALIFVLGFLGIAALWRRQNLRLRLHGTPG